MCGDVESRHVEPMMSRDAVTRMLADSVTIARKAARHCPVSRGSVRPAHLIEVTA